MGIGGETLNSMQHIDIRIHGPRIKSGVTNKGSVGHPQSRLKDGQLNTIHDQDEGAVRSSSQALAQSKARPELVMKRVVGPEGLEPPTKAL